MKESVWNARSLLETEIRNQSMIIVMHCQIESRWKLKLGTNEHKSIDRNGKSNRMKMKIEQQFPSSFPPTASTMPARKTSGHIFYRKFAALNTIWYRKIAALDFVHDNIDRKHKSELRSLCPNQILLLYDAMLLLVNRVLRVYRKLIRCGP